jgi:alpha-amylase
MPSVCLYFEVHQPSRLRRYGVFDVGRRHDYFDEAQDEAICRRVARVCYQPMAALLEELIDRTGGRFRVSFSVTGTALGQFARWCPEVLAGFQRLARTGCAEFLAETDYHSLSSLTDDDEFERQVVRHAARVEALVGRRPTVFRNTELIYSNAVARRVAALGFRGMLAEGADHVLGWRSPHLLYSAVGAPELALLLKSYRLSDDIAFRFGDRGWKHHPLTAPRFAEWVRGAGGSDRVVNLFMDYETFGEHQRSETGIFDFMRRLPEALLARPDTTFRTPSEVLAHHAPVAPLDVPALTSWADLERDLSAWQGNAMQRSALASHLALRPAVLASGDAGLLDTWRRLGTSDHFYYMSTKAFEDGSVHAYFSPFDSPYEAHIAYMNVLADLAQRLGTPAWTPQLATVDTEPLYAAA